MKRQFKSQASSSRVASATGTGTGTGFGGFGSAAIGSTLSYLTEPPNLTNISDAQVIVSFKNLSKKDATTKSKALEDLRAYVQAKPFEQGGVEEPVLEAWVRFYPRISIDNSRRVRELSHNLQYELLKSARKRMEKHIPKIVGSWLAGTYDRDRAVARAAKDGITSFLDTEEKLLVFWKRCQSQILDFATEAMDETPQSLSDERTMSPDDVQEKYFRVVSSSISLVANLLAKLSQQEIPKQQDKYSGFLASNKKLWAFASCEDAYARRAVSHLLIICLESRSAIIEMDLEIIGDKFISEGLRSSQSGSALQLLQALDRLTAKFPQVWTSSYKSKKSPLSRLRRFVEKGSQGGPPDYWRIFRSFLPRLPPQILPSDIEGSVEFLKAFRDGIAHREEPRSNAREAWSSYFWLTSFLAKRSSDAADQGKLFQESVYPVFIQYLHPVPENSRWSIGSSTSELAKAYISCTSFQSTGISESLCNEWQRFADGLISRISTSLPEQSKDYQKSQASVIAESHRWFEFVSEVLKLDRASESDEVSCSQVLFPLISPSGQIVSTALKTIVNRDGKPYSAAATVEAALRLAPSLLKFLEDSLVSVKSFIEDNLPGLLLSPSWSHIISLLYLFRSIPKQEMVFQAAWQASVDGLMALPESSEKARAITALLSSNDVSNLAQEDGALQDFLLESTIQAVQGKTETWPLLDVVLSYQSLDENGERSFTSQVLDYLQPGNAYLNNAFKALELIATKKRALLLSEGTYVTLITRLLALAEISDSQTTSRVLSLKALMDEESKDENTGSPAMLKVIKANLETANLQSLTIPTLVSQTLELLDSSQDLTILATILLDCGRWSRSLTPLLNQPLNPSLAVMRPFAGAAFLVPIPTPDRVPQPSRDVNGYSVPLRMAMFTSKLLAIESVKDYIPEQMQVDLLYLLGLSSELANDQLDLLQNNMLFENHLDPDAISEIRQMVVDTQCLLNGLSPAQSQDLDEDAAPNLEVSPVIRKLVARLIQATNTTSNTAYFASKALGRCVGALFAGGWQKDGGENWLLESTILKRSTTNVFGTIGILVGLEDKLQGSKIVTNFLNQLVSDVAGVNLDHPGKALTTLVLLNSALAIFDGDDLPVAQNRLIFAVKQILSWNETDNLALINTEIASEACHALQKLLPGIAGVYGSYWESSLLFCADFWHSNQDGVLTDKQLPMIGMSLKLFSTLQKMKSSNDDLQDAFSETEIEQLLSSGLIELLKLPRVKEHQPLLFVDELLSRQVAKLPLLKLENLSEFYPLLASDFRMVQSAAFDALDKALPVAQQDISVDVALEDRTAQLPEELLSLLLDAPSIHNFPEEVLTEFPASVRGYLLSWHLVFDAYTTASFKVRNDYSDVLKSENCIGPLLDFLFDCLGLSEANAINLEKSRFGHELIRNYDMWKAIDSETNERDMQWLLINLYYLALKYTPALVRNWKMECDSRQTSMAVEQWTERFFSPLVIEDALNEVSKWAEDQEVSEDEKPLVVRISNRSREVNVGYEIDELMIQIAIHLPANYPLDNIQVEGVNRVAASEKKWTSWLRVTQGVITFSGGSIIDGLNTFRKNVLGHLAGRTECAICYSVISSDKRVPEKRCSTCKNLFHSSCLFKWFASSNQSTCPLCRVPFNYGIYGPELKRARAAA